MREKNGMMMMIMMILVITMKNKKELSKSRNTLHGSVAH